MLTGYPPYHRLPEGNTNPIREVLPEHETVVEESTRYRDLSGLLPKETPSRVRSPSASIQQQPHKRTPFQSPGSDLPIGSTERPQSTAQQPSETSAQMSSSENLPQPPKKILSKNPFRSLFSRKPSKSIPPHPSNEPTSHNAPPVSHSISSHDKDRQSSTRRHVEHLSIDDDSPFPPPIFARHHFPQLEGLTETAVLAMLDKGHPPPYSLPDDASTEVKNFLSRCFIFDRKERPTSSQLLCDPFINGRCCCILLKYHVTNSNFIIYDC
jgi:serine/threonine protein kinase